jgi:hypothetical protein
MLLDPEGLALSTTVYQHVFTNFPSGGIADTKTDALLE